MEQKRLCRRSRVSLIIAMLVSTNKLDAMLAGFKCRILITAKRFLCALTHKADFKENGHYFNPIFLPFLPSFDENT